MNILNILANDNYFIYNKDIAKSMGIDVAIILALLCNKYNYYQKEDKLLIKDNKEFFYCTRDTIYDETGIKDACQRNAMKILRENGILEVQSIGIPAKNYYHIDVEKLSESIEISRCVKMKHQDAQKTNDLRCENRTQIINNNNINIVEEEKIEKLEKSIVETLGVTNIFTINECISYLDDLPLEVIQYALETTARKNAKWNYAKTILNGYIKNNIDSLDKIKAEELAFKGKSETAPKTEDNAKAMAERLRKRMGLSDED